MPAVEQLISEAQTIFVSLYEYKDFKVTFSDLYLLLTILAS